MKVVIVSNSFNHHQKPLSDALYKRLGMGFCFIETRSIRQERLDMGWGMEEKPDYVKQNYIDEENAEKCRKLIDKADVVIHGSAPVDLIKERLKQGKLTFAYSERVYKSAKQRMKYLWHLMINGKKGYRNPKMYLLCASAYTAWDYAKSFCFMGRGYKWGYFPRTKKYNVDYLFESKRRKTKVSILWAGRFLKWKHPEVSVIIAERLRQNGYDFNLNIIGSGEMEETLVGMVAEKNMGNCVHFLGTMSPEQVREYMEAADIYLFTSDFNEGWGAVLNEAMNSGCAVVASHAIGSVPYLIRDEENGFIYRNNDLNGAYNRVVRLIEQPELRENMGKEAYRTISELWNAEIAAKRLIQLADALLSGRTVNLFIDGPCSKARLITNGWFKNGKNH